MLCRVAWTCGYARRRTVGTDLGSERRVVGRGSILKNALSWLLPAELVVVGVICNRLHWLATAANSQAQRCESATIKVLLGLRSPKPRRPDKASDSAGPAVPAPLGVGRVRRLRTTRHFPWGTKK